MRCQKFQCDFFGLLEWIFQRLKVEHGFVDAHRLAQFKNHFIIEIKTLSLCNRAERNKLFNADGERTVATFFYWSLCDKFSYAVNAFKARRLANR